MKEPQDAGKYQVNNDGPVQGQVIGDYNKVELHFHGSQNKAISPTKPQRVWNIPYLRNDYFTGREEILTGLHTRFQASNATALSQRHAMSGLGGIGKTQTAVEYAYRYHQEYQSVLWARAEGHEALTSSFVEIATLLDLPQKDEQDQTITIQAVKHWLQDNDGWLLVLDNADEPAIVREFLPTRFDGHILLTTRAQALGGLAQRVEVDTFTPKLGALFLLRRAMRIAADGALEQATPEDSEVAIEISKELGGLPLALDQAGAYMEEAQCSLSDYLDLYCTRRAEVLKERGGLTGDHPESVATTWSLSFQRVEEKNAAAADLLRLCAFLHPDAIPEEILTTGAEHLGPVLQTIANNPIALNKAIAALGAYSLINRDPFEKTLIMHRLVQAVIRDVITHEEDFIWYQRIILTFNAIYPEESSKTWNQCERLTSHLLHCTKTIKESLLGIETVEVLRRGADYLTVRARYEQGESLYQQALHICKQQLELEHPAVGDVLNGLASLRSSQGRYIEAEQLYLEAVQIYEQHWGPEHSQVAAPLNRLGYLYKEVGKYSEAEAVFQRVLRIWKQHLGPEHHMVGYPLNGLAILCREQGKYSEAEALYQRALQIWEQQLGPNDRLVASPLHGLAYICQEQGKYAEAEMLYQRALYITKQSLGEEHPHVAYALYGLGSLSHIQGKYAEAELFYQHAMRLWEQTGNTLHPEIAHSLNGLACICQEQGKYAEAEMLYQRALYITEQSLGQEHLNMAYSLDGLASLRRRQGRSDQAEVLYKQALCIREQHLGSRHPHIASSFNNLAALYDEQGRFREAAPLYEYALSIYEEILGVEHPITKTTQGNYSAFLKAKDGALSGYFLPFLLDEELRLPRVIFCHPC